jgi:arginine/serine-rich splicing factor 4/5/6
MLKNGYGFVEFDDYKDADDAIHDLNGRELCGERVMLEIAKGIPLGAGGAFVSGYVPPPSNSKYYSNGSSSSRGSGGRPGFGRPSNGYKIIVENLSTRCAWQDLKDMMKKYGDVLYVDAHHYRRNEGVVEFAHKSDMEYAVEKLNGKEINGRKMKLIAESDRYSRSPSPEQKSRSRSGGRDKRSKRSRSRSTRDDDYDKSNGRDGDKSDGDRSRSGSPPPKSKARSKTPDDHRDDSPDNKREKSRGSRTPDDRQDDSPDENKRDRSRSRSHSDNEGNNGYRSRSGSPNDRESRSRSRSS